MPGANIQGRERAAGKVYVIWRSVDWILPGLHPLRVSPRAVSTRVSFASGVTVDLALYCQSKVVDWFHPGRPESLPRGSA
jgi:hypothetical protein